ncbi:tyrosine--tRNA ligase [Criblamydia sequanensis]|uniref:Tyrosine--tRNA ligase n=1 Tax=Candidatus Criblamydia sequanensis CRIB-18 TaxID=1437425 RepID=A0A090DYB7_9BACT|nr:tyrosine--tRNA ligase [Criblamydia sequanensis]CDR33719.1 Tyrosyl-tRNA synthetase [Criblamydia sequanensis CRIB-18]
MKTVIDILKERGFIESLSSDELSSILSKPQKIYCGFDPTADSLHLGNLVAIIGLTWFQRFGHTPVVIVGGATGMIGDPGGKSVERNLQTQEQVDHNLKGIKALLENVIKGEPAPLVLNNFEWMKKFSFIDFLRDVGKHFRMSVMLAKESVKARLESEEGISFTEFSYQLLQAYDFLYLFQNHHVKIQIGGSDQWGNIVGGVELIRKVLGESAFGVTFPLLTRSDGKKFGKSENGAIWLSKEKLSPYEFYQYLVRVPDADVIKLMKMLTFLDLDVIAEYENAMKQEGYLPNTAQKKLAEEVTRFVHGEEGLEKALLATKAAAPGSETVLDADSLEIAMKDMPYFEPELLVGSKLIDLIADSGLRPSKSAARRLIREGGVSLNNKKINDEEKVIQTEDLIGNRFVVVTLGKKQKMLVKQKKI